MINIKKITYKNFSKSISSFRKFKHERTIKAKKNIYASFIAKGLNIAIGFVQLPIALNYIGETRYGIWLILGSIIAWFEFFDIGLGNGLRNKFAEAVAKEDKKSAKVYISTTYFLMTVIIGAVSLIFLIISPFLNWVKILNVPPGINENLTLLVFIVFISFAVRFVVKLITTILVADQRPGVRDIILAIAKVLNLGLLIVLVKTTEGSLIYLSIIYSFTPLFLLLVASIYFFSKDYREYIPSYKYVDLSYSKALMNLGIRFFIIQIAVLVVYTTDNMIITQLYDPAQVTIYNIARRYFSIITMGYLIVVTPFWSGVTEAYNKSDFSWIKKTVQQLIIIWSGFFLLAATMLVIGNWVYKIWVGPDIEIPFLLSLICSLYVVLFSFNSIFIFFINGTGKIKIQIYVAVFNMLFNIPLSIFFAKYLSFGIAGVLMGTLVSSVIGLILGPLQYYKIITQTAKGIWNE